MNRYKSGSVSKNKSSKQSGTNLDPKKLRLLSVGIAVFFIAVVVFIYRWQIKDHAYFMALASSRMVQKEIPSIRGSIEASDGSVLAYSEPRFNIYVYMDEKQGLLAAENAGRQSRSEFLEKVSGVLDIEEEDLKENLEKDSKWIKIAEKVTKETRDDLITIPSNVDAEVFLDGINYEDTSIRVYPEETLASHIVGFVGKNDFGEEYGASGLEQYFDGILKPQAGISSLETDSNQNVIALSDIDLRQSRRGATIKTTIDKNIQVKVEKLLKEGVEKYMARSGTVIVYDPRTGEVISLANYPDFDPGEYFNVEDSSVLGNIAVTNPYEIGSVGKVYTMSAAVDQGKVNPQTVVIDGHDGCQEIIEKKIICTYDKKPQGALTATEAMIKSDNLALFSTAEMVGEKRLANYLEAFGLGEKTQIQLSGEDSGYIKDGDKWNEADLAAYSYGHSYFQTTMQATAGLGVLANDGKRMEPMIVKELIESDGTVRRYEPKVIEKVLKPESTETMAEILYEVYKHNLSYDSKYDGLEVYRIGMKSGTALIPYTALNPPKSKPGYSDEVNATYIGYDASDKNTFMMLVNLSEPQTQPKLSYNNARKLWLDIFIEIKDDLGVPVVY
jgi:cell division protein FtsI/penicillin-binding protein 2